MILKPIAKPVRIRIKSGGMEHSSVESLKSHFVVDDIKDLVADGRLSRWLEQQNHRSIPNEILALNKDSMEFALAVYRFFFDEKNAMSDGEVYYCLYQETSNDAYLNKSAKEQFPKALIELDERRKKAEEEARRKAEEARRKAEEEAKRKVEEEARKKMNEYLLVGKNRYVEFYQDCGERSKWANDLPKFDTSTYRILTRLEWEYLVRHCSNGNSFCKKYRDVAVFYKDTGEEYEVGVVGQGSFFPYTDYFMGKVLLFKDVEI